MRRLISILTGATLALTLGVGSVAAGNGPPQVGFLVDGTPYRTVGTKTDFSGTGAPAHSFDTIYDLGGGGLLNVASSAPGDRDYNGGRWMVLPVSWDNIAPTQFMSEEEILAAALAGDITIGDPVKYFECPVIKLQGNRR
jgi:hypothetical protein